jgi:hypothetical protein
MARRLSFILFMALLGVIAMPQPAQSHGWWGGGFGCCGYFPVYAPLFIGFGVSDEPSTIVYVPPSPAPPPRVTYIQLPPQQQFQQPQQQMSAMQAPPPQPYQMQPPPQQPMQQQSGLPIYEASPIFTDNMGHSCRNFKLTMNGSPTMGTVCLQPDGTWRTMAQ